MKKSKQNDVCDRKNNVFKADRMSMFSLVCSVGIYWDSITHQLSVIGIGSRLRDVVISHVMVQINGDIGYWIGGSAHE